PNVVVWDHEAASAKRAFDEAEKSTCVEVTRQNSDSYAEIFNGRQVRHLPAGMIGAVEQFADNDGGKNHHFARETIDDRAFARLECHPHVRIQKKLTTHLSRPSNTLLRWP